MPTGKIKWYNAQKGYGFIKPDTGGADVFLHQSALQWAGLSNIAEGQRVEYELRNKPDGRVFATNLRLLENEDAA